MKRFLLFMLLLLFVGTNNVGAYTDKGGDIVYHTAAEADLDSTLFFPKGFLDGSVIDGFSNQPMGVGRTHYIEAIDGKNTNCFGNNINYDRKCFLRHGGIMNKIDIGGAYTVYPTLNNVFEVSVDKNIQTGRFEFGLSGFGVTNNIGLANGGEMWNGFLRNKGLKDNQGTAVEIFAIDKNGDEIKNGSVPLDFKIYMEGPNGEEIPINETVGKRQVVSSLNKQLNRGFCVNHRNNMFGDKTTNIETTEKAYGSDCIGFNMIYGLTPKLYVKMSDVANSGTHSGTVASEEGSDLQVYKFGVRIFPVVRGKDGNLYEPSYVADKELGKLSFSSYVDTSDYGIPSRLFGLLQEGESVKGGNTNQKLYDNHIAVVAEMSNYYTFQSNSTVRHNGIVVPKTKFHQIMSVLKKNGDDQKGFGANDQLSPYSSEFLNYYGNFVTHQVRGSNPHYGSYYGVNDNEKNSFVVRSTLGNEVGASGNGVTSKYFQAENFFREGMISKGTKELVVMTLDMDNGTSAYAGPSTPTTIGFASLGPKTELKKVQKTENIDEFLRNTMLTEAFDRWREGGTTPAYLSDIVRHRDAPTLEYPLGNLFYERNGKKLIPFLKTQAEVNAYNEALTDKKREVTGVSKMITLGNNYGKDTSNGFSFINQDADLKFKNKGFNWSGGGFTNFSIQEEGTAEVNSETDDAINIQNFRHGQANTIVKNGFTGFGKSGFGIAKIPVYALFTNQTEKDEYLDCKSETDCSLKKNYVFRYYISKSLPTNAIGYAFSTNHFIEGDNCEEGGENGCDELVPIDLGLKMNQLCTFRKAVADTDPSQAYYKLLNADKSCKDIVVKHLFSATQDQGTDAFNQAWTIKEEPIENPTEPLQPGQRATMEVNHTNVCDLAFVGKVIASNTDILQRDIKDLKLRISSIPKNVEMLDAADINVGDKSVKFKSKPKGSDMNVENPILNTLGLLPGEDTKKVQGDFIIQACNGDIYRTPLNGDSDEQELYLKLEADSNAWAKSKGSKVCQYAFEYAFRPLAPQCSAIDTNTYGTDDSGEITVGKVKNGEPATFKYPEDGSNRVVKDYEGFTSKSGEMAKYLTFTDMRIGNFGFCFELIKNTWNKL